MKLGINLAGVIDWSTELVFRDSFKAGRTWTSQSTIPGAGYGTGPPLDLTPDGWPRSIPSNSFAESLLYTELQGRYFSGRYMCMWTGEATIEFNGAAYGVLTAPGVVLINPNAEFLAIRVRATNPANSIRNLSFTKLGLDSGTTVFDPLFVNRYSKYSTIRFMDWQNTNNQQTMYWSNRTLPTAAMQTVPTGVALEHCCQLANQTQANVWLCVPHLADDDYVWQMANLVNRLLNNSNKIYLEYSNECWNAQFNQTAYVNKKGGPAFYLKRSGEVFKIFARVLGSTDRLVRVLGCQSDNPSSGAEMLRGQLAGWYDAIAIAPYWGHGDQFDDVANMSVQQIITRCYDLIAKVNRDIAFYKQLADRYNVKLVAYEGGQHIVGVGAQQNDPALTAKFIATNRDPGMYDLYRSFFESWPGELFCVFSSCSKPSKSGSWGLLEYSEQDPETAPKFRAIRDLINSWPGGNK